ncbi:hypothetical protein BJ742DRAFT_74742 [Cladochytrium replicatum]|nr:hypothetical protein BJ742DRAFT_74742 [Cladochytrium replicatum]
MLLNFLAKENLPLQPVPPISTHNSLRRLHQLPQSLVQDLTDVSMLTKIPHLHVVSLSSTSITSFATLRLRRRTHRLLPPLQLEPTELRHLSGLDKLRVVWLGSGFPRYRRWVVRHVPQLDSLDDVPVTRDRASPRSKPTRSPSARRTSSNLTRPSRGRCGCVGTSRRMYFIKRRTHDVISQAKHSIWNVVTEVESESPDASRRAQRA